MIGSKPCRRPRPAFHLCAVILASIFVGQVMATDLPAGGNQFSVSTDQVLFNGRPFKVIGIRTSNALISDGSTRRLIDNLDAFKSYGVNTVSVFFMGSRFGDVKGYRSDASLDPTYAVRIYSRLSLLLLGVAYSATRMTMKMKIGRARASQNSVLWCSRSKIS